MTTFEILTIVFYAVVVMIGYLICRGIAIVIDNQQETDSNLRKMDAGLDKTIGNGKPEWGAPTDKQVFIIKFKKGGEQ